jgi:hypothetical protein
MRENEGYEIRHNSVPPTYWDMKTVAFEAARFAKALHPIDIIEIVNLATGENLLILQDGRTG